MRNMRITGIIVSVWKPDEPPLLSSFKLRLKEFTEDFLYIADRHTSKILAYR